MTLDLLALQALANQDAEQSADMNEAVKGGGGGYTLAPAGEAFARLVEVVEVGDIIQTFEGVAKPAAPHVRLGFALYDLGGRNYSNPDGTPITIRTWPLALSQNEKAKAFLLFKKLNWSQKAKTFAQLLNEAYIVNIKHSVPKKAGDKVRHELDLASFRAPLDVMTGQPYPVPATLPTLFKLFLYKNPTMLMWDSLSEFQQRDIVESENFLGSPMHSLLVLAGLPVPQKKAVDATPAVHVAASLPNVVASTLVNPSASVVVATPPSVMVSAPAVVPVMPEIAKPQAPFVASVAAPV